MKYNPYDGWSAEQINDEIKRQEESIKQYLHNPEHVTPSAFARFKKDTEKTIRILKRELKQRGE